MSRKDMNRGTISGSSKEDQPYKADQADNPVSGRYFTLKGDQRTVIDDSTVELKSWSTAELHAAMEQFFSQSRSDSWPSWHMWGMLASAFSEESDVDESVTGLMFDQRNPKRQGFAIFKKAHGNKYEPFKDLVAGQPANENQAAMREFLTCWVHEAGHAFNLPHSFDNNSKQYQPIF